MTFVTRRHFYKLLFITALAVLVCLMILSSTMGVADISFGESLRILMNKIPRVGKLISLEGIADNHPLIVVQIRMPRICLSAFVGMGLAVVGAAFQGIFRNPMASPSILGISSGATLGASITIITGFGAGVLGMGMVTLTAFAGAMLTTFLVYRIARVGNRIPVTTLLLAGIATGFLMSSVIHVLMVFNRTSVDEIVMWMMGSVAGADWNQAAVMLPLVAAGTLSIILFSKDLNVMATGDETAGSLGIEVEKVKKLLLAISSVIIAACVSVSGVVGFVGLIVPHMVRLVLGPDHRVVLPFSAVGGALFTVLCDTIARNIVYMIAGQPSEIPVGLVTSIFGAPFFIYLLIRSKKRVN